MITPFEPGMGEIEKRHNLDIGKITFSPLSRNLILAKISPFRIKKFEIK
jgi:hypothetical protein